jgi:transposase-like protein
MNCIFCDHPNVYKHGKTEKGYQRYKCPNCGKTFPEHLETLYYGRHLDAEEIRIILQSHSEGSSLRGISRIIGRAYGTVVSLVRGASQKAQMIHNQEVQKVTTEEVNADEMWSFVKKNKKTVSRTN